MYIERKMSAVGLAACCGLLLSSLGAADAPKTSEEQQTVLEGALAEGLRTRDWQMTMLAAGGLKALALRGEALETAVLRAERDAALEGLKANTALPLDVQIETWGLASRATAGAADALKVLRARAAAEVETLEPVDANLWRSDPKKAAETGKRNQQRQAILARKDFALLTLALMSDSSAKESVQEELERRLQAGGQPSANLLWAVVALEPEDGWTKLAKGAADLKTSGERFAFLAALKGLWPAAGRWMAAGDAAFRVEADLAKKLPETASSQWWDLYAATLAEWTPNTEHPGDPGMMLLNQLSTLPRPPAGHPVFAALERAGDRLTGGNAKWYKPMIDRMLKQLGATANETAVKPPKPPQEADF